MNVLAVFAAAASAFVLGGLWYSPKLFGTLWNAENGGPKQQGHPAKVFGIAFVHALVAAAAFALLLGPRPELVPALKTGALVGIGFVATSFGINYQFAQRSMKLWAIDAGYHAAQFLLVALILGAWN